MKVGCAGRWKEWGSGWDRKEKGRGKRGGGGKEIKENGIFDI
jgi:hypothetical protein